MIPMGQVTITTAHNDVIKISGEDIYRAYFVDISPNEFIARLYGLEIMTVDRIEQERELLGFIKCDWSNETKAYEVFKQGTVQEYQGFDNSTLFLVGKTLDEKNWAARFWIQIEDDTHCYTLYFNQQPNREQIIKAYHLDNLASQMQLFPLRQPERFICRSCHQEVFWLDTASEIFDCGNNARNKYCGHC